MKSSRKSRNAKASRRSTRLTLSGIVGLLLGTATLCGAAQADAVDDWHTWGAVIATGPLGSEGTPYRFWAEGQGRFNDDTSRFNQGFLRVAGGYALAPRTAVWAGYGYFTNNLPSNDENTVEHRIWQQLTWAPAERLAGFALSSRTRLEQRQIESAADTGWRFRQMFKLTHPLFASDRYYLSLWDEVFVHLDDTDWGADAGFDQNRAFAGLGVRVTPQVRTEIGYLNQYVRRAGRDNARNHILSITFLLNF